MGISRWIHDQVSESTFWSNWGKLDSLKHELHFALRTFEDIPQIVTHFANEYKMDESTVRKKLGIELLEMIRSKEYINELQKILGNTIKRPLPTVIEEIDRLDTLLNSSQDLNEVIFVTKDVAAKCKLILTPNYFMFFLADETRYAENKLKDGVSGAIAEVVPFFGILSSIFDAASSLSDLALGEFTPTSKAKLKSMIKENDCFALSYLAITDIQRIPVGENHLLTIVSNYLEGVKHRSFFFNGDQEGCTLLDMLYLFFLGHCACQGNLIGLKAPFVNG